MDRNELEQRIAGMINEIEQARVNLSKGEDFELDGIGERVTEACADATALSDEDSVLLKPMLEELRADLENFSYELGEIARRLKEIEEEEKAAAQNADGNEG